MLVCVCTRKARKEGGGGSEEHISVSLNVGVGRMATLFEHGTLVDLFVAIPTLQRPRRGYYHLASVNTSYAVEL